MKRKLIQTVILVLAMSFLCSHMVLASESKTLIGQESESASGEGTEPSPYTYLINLDSKVTWKHLIENRDRNIFEVYECREEDKEKGKISYSWTFLPQNIATPEGPYFLGVYFYRGDRMSELFGADKFYLSCLNKRDFGGSANLTVDVSSKFKDGDHVYVYYYGGYDSTVVHAGSPTIDENQVFDKDSEMELVASALVVTKGYVSMDIRNGGNYFISLIPMENLQIDKEQEVLEKPEATKVLGAIDVLFPNVVMAAAIGNALHKELSEVVKQSEMDGIKKLYVADTSLSDMEALGKLYFDKLESLTMTGVGLTKVSDLKMPAMNYLDLSNNRLVEVNELTSLPNLQNINLQNNALTSLPDFGYFKKLISVDVSGNALEVFPFVQSDTVRYIDASNNHITKGFDLSKCTKLEEINLLGQTLEVKISGAYKKEVILYPEIDIITSYGKDVGEVTIFNYKKQPITTMSYQEFKAYNFHLPASLFPQWGEYTVIVKGYMGIVDISEANDANTLGTYTYHVHIKMPWYSYLVLSLPLLIGIVASVVLFRKKSATCMEVRYEGI